MACGIAKASNPTEGFPCTVDAKVCREFAEAVGADVPASWVKHCLVCETFVSFRLCKNRLSQQLSSATEELVIGSTTSFN